MGFHGLSGVLRRMVVVSWIVAFFPDLTLKSKNFASHGIFVKNYIDQSQEFALCAVALAYPIARLLRAKKLALALALGALALGFLANMAFVIVSRTALVTIPIMLLAFAVLHLRWQTTLLVVGACLAAGVLAWFASPQLEATVDKFGQEYRQYMQEGAVTSIGERLEYYRKSLRFFAEAPVVGHGTGSIEGLFEQAAKGQTGAAADVVRNPHNQTLNVAVQWGTLGVVVLYAMWLSHLGCSAAKASSTGLGFWSWCRIFSPRCSTPTFSIFTKAGCMCSASALPVVLC